MTATRKRKPRMTKEDLKALQGSIKHWEAKIKAISPGSVSIMVAACDLCVLHVLATGSCNKCPVVTRGGGVHGCLNTPYSALDISQRFTAWRYAALFPQKKETTIIGREYARLEAKRIVMLRERFRDAARKELAFLKSLLPRGHSND